MKKYCALYLYIDPEKTFHTADHQILSQKFYHRGIWGLAHAWFKSYFSFIY